MKRSLTLLLASLFLVFSLTACGGNGKNNGQNGNDQNNSAVTGDTAGNNAENGTNSTANESANPCAFASARASTSNTFNESSFARSVKLPASMICFTSKNPR